MNLAFMFDNHTFRRINALERETRKREILALFDEDGCGSVFARGADGHALEPALNGHPIAPAPELYKHSDSIFSEMAKKHMYRYGVTIEEVERFLDQVDELENWEAR